MEYRRRACPPKPASQEWRRREPEKTVLYRAVLAHLNEFLERADARAEEGRGLPEYVRGEFKRYLDCGILSRGFARVRCPECALDMLVGFS
jgi:hypothetical protein